MEELGKITKSEAVSLETKARIIHTLIFPLTVYRYRSWTVMEVDRKKKKDSFEIWGWRKAL